MGWIIAALILVVVAFVGIGVFVANYNDTSFTFTPLQFLSCLGLLIAIPAFVTAVLQTQ